MTNIVDKLKLNNYLTKTILNQPADTSYFTKLEQHDLAIRLTERVHDLIFVFTYSKEEFFRQIHDLTMTQTFNPMGYLFVAYPKIGNPHYPDTIHRDEIFPTLGIDSEGDGYLGKTDFKFSRMVSLDNSFTVVGLKYVPKKLVKKTTASSSKVADYTSFISLIIENLLTDPDVLTLFNTLPPGYQRGWARYIYSAKQLTTQTKRYQEMLVILRAGYKSKELYQKR